MIFPRRPPTQPNLFSDLVTYYGSLEIQFKKTVHPKITQTLHIYPVLISHNQEEDEK